MRSIWSRIRAGAEGAGGAVGPRAAGVVALLGAVVVTGCAAALASGPDPGELAGCYRFERNAGAEELRLPWGLLLRTQPLEEGWPSMQRFDDVHAALTLESASRWVDHPFGYWRPTEGDSVEVGHPGGGGVVLVLAPEPEGDGLAGRARDAGDVIRPGQDVPGRASHPVRLSAVECGSDER